jgi:hypothetical protein
MQVATNPAPSDSSHRALQPDVKRTQATPCSIAYASVLRATEEGPNLAVVRVEAMGTMLCAVTAQDVGCFFDRCGYRASIQSL